ncbi:MAG TPA: class I adenylate-forming enzyme family protein [Candidatus Angelobacter sp.]|nr:class I adenylate-forming enzyme family protein [Candidatus Angelobacter sp.]
MSVLQTQNLAELLDNACAIYGNQVAVTGHGKLSYSALQSNANNIASSLNSQGILPNEPILITITNTAPDLAAFYGVWKAGGVAVPLHVKSVPATVADIISRVGPRFLVRGDATTPLPEGVNGNGAEVVRWDAAPPADRKILKDAAYIIFTSGSTGVPKGVVLSHAAFATKLSSIQSVLPFATGKTTLLVLQLTFSFGQWVTLLTLATGGKLAMLPRFDAVESLEALIQHRADRIAVVPTMMRAWAAVENEKMHSLFEEMNRIGCPELLIAGGEPLPAPLGLQFRQRLPRTSIADVFGLTETSTSDFILPPADYDQHPGTIGWPTPGVRFRIVSDRGQVCGPSEPGELQIQTRHIMNGYLDALDITAASFQDGFMKTGDIGQLTEKGTVVLVGRSKELIVRGGNKISPLEIERIFAGHPNVAATLATGVPDDLMGERIHLLVVPRAGIPLSKEELIEWGGLKLERYKLPDRIHFSDTVPVGKTGKADRQALRAWIVNTAEKASAGPVGR